MSMTYVIVNGRRYESPWLTLTQVHSPSHLVGEALARVCEARGEPHPGYPNWFPIVKENKFAIWWQNGDRLLRVSRESQGSEWWALEYRRLAKRQPADAADADDEAVGELMHETADALDALDDLGNLDAIMSGNLQESPAPAFGFYADAAAALA